MAGRIDAVIRGAGVVIVAGVLAGGGAYVINEGGGGVTDEANAFVNTTVTGDTCTRSSTPVTFAEAEAANHLCGSIDAAYTVASAGDTIMVKAGSYGVQDVADRSGLSTSTFVFVHPAPGESATFAELNVATHDIHIDGGDTINENETDRFTVTDGMTATMTGGQGDTRDVIMEDIHTNYSYNTAHGVTIQYSEIGPLDPCNAASEDLVRFWPNNGAPQNMYLLYNVIHDANQQACLGNGGHPDGIQSWPDGGTSDNINIVGNRFWWCGTQCIFLGDGNYTNSTVSNNMIEETDACGNCGGAGDVNFFSNDGTANGNTVYYNTIEGSAVLPTNAAAVGNVFLSTVASCGGASYSYNRFPAAGGTTCGTNATRCTPLFVGGSYSGDTDAEWHISLSDTCLRETGNPSVMPAKDLDEESRPNGTVDAGADEVG